MPSPVDDLPDPGPARTLDDLADGLRRLKVWAGDPSYESLKDRVNAAWTEAGRPPSELAGKTTVVDCFRPGRRRVNAELVTALVAALHPDPGYVAQWRQALRVVTGESRAAAQVRVQQALPPDLPGFTGRVAELARLRAMLDRDGEGDVVVITGMAGVGKTRLAIRAAHTGSFDRYLFVNMRGFHPDQPPADPAAILDGFLRLLGQPGHQVPHDVAARTAAYRARLAGSRTLVLLDDAADEEQVRPLLPATPGCRALVTSRRRLAGLACLMVDVFTPAEAGQMLALAAPDSPVGTDPDAAARIAHRCGHLPLALGLVAGHISGKPGWTLTDHADRLDERHLLQRLDTGVELALDLSYRNLSGDAQRLLRLLALHPGQDVDAHAAAALTGTDLPAAAAHLHHLGRNHLLLPAGPDRYALHDLVRAYASARAGDEDPPAERRAALTRLFDYYLATAAVAMDVLVPVEAHLRPRVAEPATAPPPLADACAARTWLDSERPTLVAVAVHAGANGWPGHTTRLSTTLFRYLAGGHLNDAFTVHGAARQVAEQTGDRLGLARALNNLAIAHTAEGRFEPAADLLHQALIGYEQVNDRPGVARALGNLGMVEERLGRKSAVDHLERALPLFRALGDVAGEARTDLNLGLIDERLGRLEEAADRFERALGLSRRIDDRPGIASALRDLGGVEIKLDRHAAAGDHLRQALAVFRELGNADAEAWTLDSLGSLHTSLGDEEEAAACLRRALAIHRDIGDRHGEAWALNALGEVASGHGRPADALRLHGEAEAIAVGTGADELARAHAGLARAHRDLGDRDRAGAHYRQALSLYSELGMPAADEVRAALMALDAAGTL
jgi:tetratricopeptide (TPR) repeat protein